MGKDNRQRRAAKRRDRDRAARAAPNGSPHQGARGRPTEQTLFDDLFATAASQAGDQAGWYERITELRGLIDRAAWLVAERMPGSDAAIDELRILSTHAADAKLDPADLLNRELIASLAQCWERGWQPADLDHFIRRETAAKVAAWAPRIINAEALNCRAVQRAPQEWIGQLEVFSDDPSELLRLAGRASDDDWTAALTLLDAVRRLPAIEALIPRPSVWDRVRQSPPTIGNENRARPANTESDAKMLARIRALLTKAEKTDYPAEAESFTAKAQALMTRHAIDEALVHAEVGDNVDVRGRRVHIENPYALEKATLLSRIAEANRVKAIWSEFAGFATIVGVPTDLDQVHMLHTSLLIQATRAMTKVGEDAGANTVKRSSSFRRSFLLAFSIRIGERLSQATDDAVAEYGTALVPVFARQQQAVDEEYTRMFPNVKAARAGRTVNPYGWHAGTTAADKAVLAAGQVGR